MPDSAYTQGDLVYMQEREDIQRTYEARVRQAMLLLLMEGSSFYTQAGVEGARALTTRPTAFAAEVVEKALEAAGFALLILALSNLGKRADQLTKTMSPTRDLSTIARKAQKKAADDIAQILTEEKEKIKAADDVQEMIDKVVDLAARRAERAIAEAEAELVKDLPFTHKKWHTQLDERVRPSHATLEGVELPDGVPFPTITGARLMFPGDPTAPLRETINCRCYLTYSIKSAAA